LPGEADTVSPGNATHWRPVDSGISSIMPKRTFTHPKTGAPAKMNTAAIGERPVP
jgi:hypothetical protein